MSYSDELIKALEEVMTREALRKPFTKAGKVQTLSPEQEEDLNAEIEMEMKIISRMREYDLAADIFLSTHKYLTP